MSIVQTTLIFAGIPAVATLIVAALVYARSAERSPRYRPGGPWQFEPVWYLPHPEHSGPVSSMHQPDLHGAGQRDAELQSPGQRDAELQGVGQRDPALHDAALHGAGQRGAGQHGVGQHGAGLRSDGARPAITGRVPEPATASGGASGEW